jgi:hypothetical protein
MVGRKPFSGASCYPTMASRDRAGVRSVNGWAFWISLSGKDQPDQQSEAKEEHSGLVDAECPDLRPSVPSTEDLHSNTRITEMPERLKRRWQPLD